MRDLDTLLGALTDRLLQAEARLEELERHETPGSLAFGWAGAVGMLQMMPGLVGLWPGAGIRGSDHDGVADVSGNGLHLARTGGARIGATSVGSLVATMAFNGTDGFFGHSDAAAFDITGTEVVVNPADRGLTLGGWFQCRRVTTGEVLMSKWTTGTGANNSYLLSKPNTGAIAFGVTSSVVTAKIVQSDLVVVQDAWSFIAARLLPSESMQIWVNDATYIDTTAAPADITAGSAPFNVGARNSTLDFFDGRAALCFLCAAAVPDVMIESFYQYSKGLFRL